MLFLLGGAARSGKSIIARRMLAERGIPFFCLDFLAHGVARTFPQLQIDLDSDDATVGEHVWPLAKAVATMIMKNQVDYLLEGALLQPKEVKELLVEFPDHVQPCFVGYADANIDEKFTQVRQYGGGPDDWMAQFDDDTVRTELARLKMVSRVLREECHTYQVRYFEMSRDFGESIQDVVAFLLCREHNGERSRW